MCRISVKCAAVRVSGFVICLVGIAVNRKTFSTERGSNDFSVFNTNAGTVTSTRPTNRTRPHLHVGTRRNLALPSADRIHNFCCKYVEISRHPARMMGIAGTTMYTKEYAYKPLATDVMVEAAYRQCAALAESDGHDSKSSMAKKNRRDGSSASVNKVVHHVRRGSSSVKKTLGSVLTACCHGMTYYAWAAPVHVGAPSARCSSPAWQQSYYQREYPSHAMYAMSPM